MKPETLLALAQAFSDKTPPATLISVRGYEFELGDELSEATEQLAAQAVERVLEMVSDTAA
jgi:hypothetical protein